MDAAQPQPRARLLIALGAALALILLVVVVIASSGGGDESESFVAAPECIDAWNENASATAYGRHNFNFHLYTGALVTFLTDDAAQVGKGEGGRCAVIFPSQALDPEPFAAGQILQGKKWLSLSSLDGVALTRVAELQAEAAATQNTAIETTGRLLAAE